MGFAQGKLLRKLKNLLFIPVVFVNWPTVYINIFKMLYSEKAGRTATVKLRTGDSLVMRLKRDMLDIGSIIDIFGAQDYKWRFNPPSDSTIIDIGASIGDFTLYWAGRLKMARLLAYEVDPEAFEILKINLRQNEMEGRAAAFEMAVAGAPGVVEISGNKIEAITLGEILNSQGVERCALCKIDIEGMEYDVLLAATREVLMRIDAIVIECHECTGNERLELLKSHLLGAGYRIELTPVNAYDACLMYCIRQ